MTTSFTAVVGAGSPVLRQAVVEAAGLAESCGSRAAQIVLVGGAARDLARLSVPARRTAARCSRQLAAKGIPAKALGRIVFTVCDGDAWADEARRAIGSADLPVVLACLRPRDNLVDELLAAADCATLVADGNPIVESIALDELRRLAGPSKVVDAPSWSSSWASLVGFGFGRLSDSQGQATVELIAVMPLLFAVSLCSAQLLATGFCRELASSAAGAGASALLQDRDPVACARLAVPGWSRARMEIRRRGRSVTVVVKPPTLVPGVASFLSSEVKADAGPPA